MNQDMRLKLLSQRCVATHTNEDIWEHLEEEMAELLLAIRRVRRRREPIINVIEELVDVKIEINTVLTMINRPDMVTEMIDIKLDKFEIMLEGENQGFKLVNRYHPIPQIY